MAILEEIVEAKAHGRHAGIPSYCTASLPVLRALMRRYRNSQRMLLIEATANQVNQDGGYTGMRPADYAAAMQKLAGEEGFPLERLCLGGDHLGPLTWQKLPEAEAMQRAQVLVEEFVAAGFRKIHLDTSMRLGDDDPSQPLDPLVCAQRGARLFAASLAVLREQKVAESDWPSFVIGSEVPVPGGVSGALATLSVTRPEAYLETVEAYRQAFAAEGLSDAFRHITAVVVQPGVEYSDHSVAIYQPEAARELMAALRQTPGLMFEGHSTDYQPEEALEAMVRDGTGILKVGPMLTFAYREALYALAEMEKWLVPEASRSQLMELMEKTLTEHPEQWQKYYHGTPEQQRLDRHFSYSDRIRYYWPRPEVQKAVQQLLANYQGREIPVTLLSQYAPGAGDAAVHSAEELIDWSVGRVAERYEAACHGAI